MDIREERRSYDPGVSSGTGTATVTGARISREQAERIERKSARVIWRGSVVEAFAGVVAIVLGIIGLANVSSLMMLSIGALAIGVALVIEGGVSSWKVSSLLREADPHTYVDMGGGMTVEFLTGVAGTALSVLALLGVSSLTMLSSAAVLYGAGLILSSHSLSRLNSLILTHTGSNERLQHYARQAVFASAGTQVFIGVASVLLGIVALTGVSPLTVSLVAILLVGCSALLSGASISGRMWSVIGH